MVEALDQMLEPGERVLWRSRWNWVPLLWPVPLAALAVLVYLLVWWENRWAHLAALALGLMLARSLLGAFVRWQTHALITDRRVLYRGFHGGTGATEVPLGTIVRVEGHKTPATRLRSGETVTFCGIRQDWLFGKTLARTAGVPCRPALGAMEEYDTAVKILVWFSLSILIAIAEGTLRNHFGAPGVSHTLPWAMLLLFLLILWPRSSWMFLPAICLVRGLLLLFLCPFLPAGQARDWLCQDAGRKDGRWAQPPGLMLTLKWASLLYGQTLRCEDNGAEGGSHG